MPKPHTFPALYDVVKALSISFLSKEGYLKPNQWQSGTITWSRNREKTGSISININTHSKQPYIELDYKCNETLIFCIATRFYNNILLYELTVNEEHNRPHNCLQQKS